MTGDFAKWLLTPLSGGTHHELPLWTAWHGRFMVAAWAIAFPLGVLVARYFKVMPRQAWPDELDNKTWWHWHRILQTAGMLLMTVGCGSPWGMFTAQVGWRNFIAGSGGRSWPAVGFRRSAAFKMRSWRIVLDPSRR